MSVVIMDFRARPERPVIAEKEPRSIEGVIFSGRIHTAKPKPETYRTEADWKAEAFPELM